ncbi:hypothetical protein SEA_JUMBO_99 [Gordonia phage Jumbo]|uniref:Uncharacterized protein n=1 Tax=Gordonia phage Jumbo TaxID=1887650 RepID=A0A1B3B0W1_9CAUD|nr:hypothetical protein BIZ69_gp099 [Gordonia phage Jumbo]AOE44606.1 hypothetical protein SEA_JUMBO_99 [Gordonia phage Jumbo]
MNFILDTLTWIYRLSAIPALVILILVCAVGFYELFTSHTGDK